MPKTIFVKLTTAGADSGPYTVKTNFNTVLGSGVSKASLLEGISYSVSIDASSIIVTSSNANCGNSVTLPIPTSVAPAPTPTPTPTPSPTATPAPTPTSTPTPTPTLSGFTTVVMQASYTAQFNGRIINIDNDTSGLYTSTNITSAAGITTYANNTYYVAAAGTLVTWAITKTNPNAKADDVGYAELIVNGNQADIFNFIKDQNIIGSLKYTIYPTDIVQINIIEG